MEAGLLNAFRDEEHFDGDYHSSGYHHVTNIWENDDSMKIGLTETLEGILPPSPELNTDYVQKQDIFKYSNYGTDDNNEIIDCMTPNVEIISVDPNCDYSSPISNNYITDNSSDSCNDDNYQSDININFNDNNIEYYLPDIKNDNLLLTSNTKINNNSLIKCKTKKRVYRKSFSLPLSPTNNIRSSPIELSELSFDDIDITHIANQITFSPIKTIDNTSKLQTPGKSISNYNDYNDDGLTKLIELDKNFDLTSFITEDDCNLLPITPGKNINYNYNLNLVTSNCDDSNIESDTDNNINEKLNTRRSCVVKSLKRGYKNLNFHSDSDSDEIDIETVCDTKLLVNNEKTGTKEQIKSKDDASDPTWIPTPIVKVQKINKKANRGTVLPQAKISNEQTLCMKMLNPGIQLSKNKLSKPAVSQVTEKTIQIDHDYCSPTKNVNHNMNKDANKIKSPTTIFSIMRKQKHKFGLGRGKNISMCTNKNTNDTTIHNKPNDNIITLETVTSNIFNHKENLNDLKINNNNVIKNTKVTNNNNEILNINDNIKSDITNNSNDKIAYDEKLDKTSSVPIVMQKSNAIVMPIKKKLNLQEYKLRRNCTDLNKKNSTLKCKNNVDVNVNIQKEHVECNEEQINFSSNSNLIQTNDNKISSKKLEILNIIESNDVKHNDPILEARKKILRKQELKKAACIKIIDIGIKKQTSTLQPILPLEEITGIKSNLTQINNNTNLPQVIKMNPDYEEITIVSIGCNTDITIDTTILQLKENEINNEKSLSINNNNQKLLKSVNDNNSLTTIVSNEQNKIIKSSFLLSNINDTIKKAQSSGEYIKISSSSLISSIQDVVLKKSSPSIGNSIQVSPNIGISPPDGISPGKPETARSKFINIIDDDDNEVDSDKNIPITSNMKNDNNKEHGEDKIIMHLRKDRVRTKSYAISIQTDNLPQFPTLIRLNPIRDNAYNNHSNRFKNNNNNKYNRSYSNNKRNYRQRTSSYSSSDSGRNDYNGRSSSSCYNYNNRSSTSRRSSPVAKRTRRYSSRSNRSQNSPSSSSQYNNRRSEDYHHDDRIRRSRSRVSDRSTSSIKNMRSNHNRSHSSSIGRSRSSASPDSSKNYNERRRRHYSSSISRSSSCSSSRSRSRSRSRSKSQSSIKSRCSSSRYRYRSNERNSNNNNNRNQTLPEERRIVYVGRIEKETTKEDLKKKFISYGPIKQITLHYKDITGVKYGFVTYERPTDAYNAIDCGTRDVKINMYDISFGGRRAFCRTSYSDLDGAATHGLQCAPVYSSVMHNGSSISSSSSISMQTHNLPSRHQPKQHHHQQQQDCITESFDDLLKKVKEKICAKKPRVKI